MQTQVLVPAFNAAKPSAALVVRKDAPIPSPADGEILVKVAVRPVNPADILG